MNKPLLVVVTGRPASGKSTLARILAHELKCPLVSRDELKEGYVNTLSLRHSEMDESAGWHIYETFFEAIALFVSKGISIVVEAAYQDKLWRPALLKIVDQAILKIILCEVSPQVAKARFAERLKNEPERDRYHGDHSVKGGGGLLTDVYEAVQMDVPTLTVDTADGYSPGIGQIIGFIR